MGRSLAMNLATGRGSFSPRGPRAFRVEYLVSLLTAVLSVHLSACLAVPVKAPRVKTPTSGTIKGKVELDFLKEGVTRKEEVRAKLAHLAAGYETPHLFVARWLDSQWLLLWAAGGYGAGGAGASRNWGTHTLFIEFDDSGVVRRVQAVPDAKLQLAIRSLAIVYPRAPPEPLFAVRVTHPHTWSLAQRGEMKMNKDGVVFREEGKKKHDFETPLSNIRLIQLHGIYQVGREPQPNQFMASVTFHKKVAGGTFLLFHVDFPELITLVRFAKEQGLPMR